MGRFRQELRHAARALARRPGWTLHAVLTLALGIGASTGVFAVANRVLFTPLPVSDPDRLVTIAQAHQQRQGSRDMLTPGRYLDLRDGLRTVDRIGALRLLQANLAGEAGGERVQVAWITSTWFPMQGVAPVLGRMFAPSDEGGQASAVALISRGLWLRQFSGRGDAIGRVVTLDGRPYTVVGVMPDVLPYPKPVDVWTPMAFGVWNRASRVMHVLAHLAPGMSVERARAEFARLDRRLAAEHPRSDGGWQSVVTPLADQVTGRARAPLHLLLAAVALLLLIACVNGANLLLALGAETETELAVRAALGADGRGLVACLFARSLLVALAGGGAGIALAWAATAAARPLLSTVLPQAAEIGMDWRVLGVGLGLVLSTSVLSGLAPAWATIRTDLQRALGQQRGATASRARRRLRDGLVVAEVALAFALMAAAGLMINSLVRLTRVETGFRTDSVMTARVTLPMSVAQYRRDPARLQFWHALLQKASAIPGVTDAGLVSSLPFGGTDIPFRFLVDDRSDGTPIAEPFEAEYRAVSPGYFSTVGIRQVAGRLVTEHDGTGRQQVVLINETLARRLWPSAVPGRSAQSALGRGVSLSGPAGPFMPIVGVVADVRHFGLDRSASPEVYAPMAQEAWPEMAVVARGSHPAAFATALRAAVRDLDRGLGVYQVKPFADVVGESTALRRLVTWLLTSFSSTALLLAAIGISGLLAFAATVRRREIGVRMALGATRTDIVRLVAGHGIRLALLGTVAGLLAAPLTSSLVETQLFGVEPLDTATLAAMAATLAIVAAIASAVPALRAARVEPTSVLRAE